MDIRHFGREGGDHLNRSSYYVDPVAAQLAPNELVLDVATGASAIPRELQRKGLQPIGIDRHEGLFMRKLENRVGTFLRADARNLPFANGVFGGVIAKDIIEHFPDGEVGNVLGEISRVLRPGGIAAVGCPVRSYASIALRRYWELMRRSEAKASIDDSLDPTHEQWFSEEELEQVLHEHMPACTILNTRYMLFGRHRFPKILIEPLRRFQVFLQRSEGRNSHSEWLQSALAFRIIKFLQKNEA